MSKPSFHRSAFFAVATCFALDDKASAKVSDRSIQMAGCAFYVKLTLLSKIADWDAELLVRPAKLLSSPFPGSLAYCWS